MKKRRKNRQDTKKVCKMDFRIGKNNAKLYSNRRRKTGDNQG